MDIIKTSIEIHLLFNTTIIFLYFLLLLELAKEKPVTKTIKIQNFYCLMFILISYMFGGFYYSTILNQSLSFGNSYIYARANLFFLMPFLSFCAFYLSFVLGDKIHNKKDIRISYSLFIFTIFVFMSIINLMTLIK